MKKLTIPSDRKSTMYTQWLEKYYVKSLSCFRRQEMWTEHGKAIWLNSEWKMPACVMGTRIVTVSWKIQVVISVRTTVSSCYQSHMNYLDDSHQLLSNGGSIHWNISFSKHNGTLAKVVEVGEANTRWLDTLTIPVNQSVGQSVSQSFLLGEWFWSLFWYSYMEDQNL